MAVPAGAVQALPPPEGLKAWGPRRWVSGAEGASASGAHSTATRKFPVRAAGPTSPPGASGVTAAWWGAWPSSAELTLGRGLTP